MPLRLSTRIMAKSAFDAAVAMLRVYSSCPGVSAAMKLRCLVEKKRYADVNRDALFALGLKTVDQKGQVGCFSSGSVSSARADERIELVVRNGIYIVQQPAMRVDFPSSTEPQVINLRRERAAKSCMLCKVSGPLCCLRLHRQKYPSRFFFSIEPVSSLSIRRPWRSEVRVPTISATISATVEA